MRDLDDRLYRACGDKHLACVQQLLAQGACPDGTDARRRPLVAAVRACAPEMVDTLLDAGADPLLCDTPWIGNLLHLVATVRHMDDLPVLRIMAAGVSATAPNLHGHTAVDLARRHKNPHLAHLMQHPVSRAAACGSTPLCLALLERGHPLPSKVVNQARHGKNRINADALRAWRARSEALRILQESPLAPPFP